MDSTVRAALEGEWGPYWFDVEPPLSCPACGAPMVGRRFIFFACRECGVRFRAHLRPRLEPPRLEPAIWMLALYLTLNGASVRQLTILGVSYKTAWRMARFLRRTLELPPYPAKRQIRAAEVIRLLVAARKQRALADRRLLREVTLLFFEVSPA